MPGLLMLQSLSAAELCQTDDTAATESANTYSTAG